MINFFTMRDFTHHGGGMIRILGLLSTLEYNCEEYRIFSNSTGAESLSRLNVENVDIYFSKNEKRIFQLCISFLPIFIVNFIFSKKLKELKTFSSQFKLDNETLVCCEYLDLSLGYYMKKNNLIGGYVCDIHGLVPNEFKTKKDRKVYNYIRYQAAKLLDKRVFSFSDGIIYASLAMKTFMENQISKLKKINSTIIPYLVSIDKVDSSVDQVKLQEIKDKYNILTDQELVFFAGSFKELGGVMDLMQAFYKVKLKRPNLILILIGSGEDTEQVKSYIEKNKLLDCVVHIPKVNYSELRTYQELADVIVCPDRYNLYSNMIIHLKYIDSLVSNKIVINGDFEAVKEINTEQHLSINFKPSDFHDLASKIDYCLNNKVQLESKFKNNANYVKRNLVYQSSSYKISSVFKLG